MGRTTIQIPADLLPDLTAHSLDSGHYQLLEKVGSGAYGKVYRALDTSQPRSSRQQIRAIKCLLKPERGSQDSLLQRQELKHHKLVSDHPNIVSFHRCFSEGPYVFVVMDFCHSDLYTAITKRRLFYRNDVMTRSVFVKLVDAVAHCHKLGIYHRDIKPENVLCSDDGSDVRLSDFGLSTMETHSTDFGCGSSFYMSPECLGHLVKRRSYATSFNDIWALGVILTNMVTESHPWHYADMDDACFIAYTKDNNFLKTVFPISEGTNEVLKRIFVVNPFQRYSLARLRSKILALDVFWSELAVENEVAHSDSEEVGRKQSVADGELSQVEFVLESDVVSGVDTLDGLIRGPSLASNDPPCSDCSSSSGPESEGPITPATRAVDVGPSVNIPDISSVVLGEAVDVQQATVLYKPREVAKATWPPDIFRAAVHRIKGLSKVVTRRHEAA